MIRGGTAHRRRGLMRMLVMICVLLVAGCVSISSPPQQAKVTRQVTVADLSGKGILREPLVPVGNPTLAENMALNEALTQYNVHALENPCSVGELEAFLKNYPDSPWQASLRLNLGSLYHQSGRFTESIAAFKQSWQLMQSCQDPKVKALADRALGELAISLAHWGRYEELEPLLQQSRKRSITGSATEMLTAAREGLYGMKKSPGNSFLCGPYALRSVCKALDKNSQQAQQIIDKVRSTRQGTSLERVWLLSQKVPGLSYQVAFRAPGAPVLTPAVMHLKVNHFCAILDPKNGKYPIEDGTAGFFRQHVSMIPAVVDQQATGYFLVPEGKLPSGWRKVSAGEAAKVWGLSLIHI